MAKDPAVLFFVNDFLTGSSLLTPLQKGHYITLLCHQQQSDSGSLSLDVVKKIMKRDFEKQWPAILEKFKKDENGFYNVRMREEVLRRKKNSKIQRENIQKRWDKPIPPYQNGMSSVLPSETETEIETVKGYGGMGERAIYPGPEHMTMELPEIKCGAVIELFRITRHQTITDKQVYGLWAVFRAQNFTGKKWYASDDDVFSHFINWSKNQKIENGKTSGKNSGTASAVESLLSGLD